MTTYKGKALEAQKPGFECVTGGAHRAGCPHEVKTERCASCGAYAFHTADCPKTQRLELDPEMIKAGREKARQLAAMTDALNGALINAEGVFQALALGVVARVNLRAGDDLAFKRLGDAWRLVVERSTGGDMPLVNAGRHLRVLAVRHLEELLDALLATMDVEIKAVEEAVASGAQFVEATKQAKKEGA